MYVCSEVFLGTSERCYGVLYKCVTIQKHIHHEKQLSQGKTYRRKARNKKTK